MTSFKTLFVCVSLLLAGCGNPALDTLPANATILAFGDSLTAGKGTSPDLSYPAVLAQLTGRDVINAGISGETTAEGLQRLPEVLDETGPRLLLFCLLYTSPSPRDQRGSRMPSSA